MLAARPHRRAALRTHRRPTFSRSLLCLLSPVHSVNLLVKMLPEQRAWRKFAGLRRQSRVPDVRMMHEFRCRVGVAGLRRINQHLLAPLLAGYLWQPWSVGLIDATDLPAACVGFKKKHRAILRRARRAGRAHAQDGAKPMFRRLQKHTLRLWCCTITPSGCSWCRWSVG